MFRLPKFRVVCKNLKHIKNNGQKTMLCQPLSCTYLNNNNQTCLITVRNFRISNKFHSESDKVTPPSVIQHTEITGQLFDIVSEETLESLTEFFENLLDSNANFVSADVSYSGGVLTINLDNQGTYVINKQSPNKQIWLSSPISGPKRYDYIVNGDFWWYKHENQSLHELLQDEITCILKETVDLSNCAHSKKL